METLTYERLDASKQEIRLLNVSVGDDGYVRCKLTTHTWGPDLEYYALSYVWGDPATTKDIIVNGKTFAATTNLVAGFENISKTVLNGSDFLWVDAMCINQNDIDERNSQVQKMDSIYRNAKATIGWLGLEENDSTQVISIMTRVSQKVKDLASKSPDISEIEAKSDFEMSVESLGSLAATRLSDLVHLLSARPFWTRVWIYQELVLAKRVLFVCDRAVFTSEDIWAIVVLISELPKVPFPASAVKPGDWIKFKILGGRVFADLSKTLLLGPGKSDLTDPSAPYTNAWKILQSSKFLEATEPRDHIYSLLGILDTGFQADYSKPVNTVYLEAATVLFEHVPMDEWLHSAAVASDNRIADLPTWVIDWRALSKVFGWSASLRFSRYNAAAGIDETQRNAKINGQTLSVFGTILDRIELPGPFFDDKTANAYETVLFDLSGGGPSCQQIFTPLPNGIPRGQASLTLFYGDDDPITGKRYTVGARSLNRIQNCIFYWIYFGRRIFEASEAAGMWDSLEGIELFHKYFPEAEKSKGRDFQAVWDTKNDERGLNTKRELSFAVHATHARHFYTKKGYLGYGPRWIKENDLVCVLQGCRVPVLLRKVDTYYHFVSTCFVLGMMDGEAAQMLSRKEVFLQEFNIH